MRHTASSILAELTDIARLVFQDPALELTMDTTGDDVPRWDSMSHIALLVECEWRFGLRFESAETEELCSVGALLRLIQAKLQQVDAQAELRSCRVQRLQAAPPSTQNAAQN